MLEMEKRMSISAMIFIPTVVPFTLQTMAVAC